jgi:hypothetical protein
VLADFFSTIGRTTSDDGITVRSDMNRPGFELTPESWTLKR